MELETQFGYYTVIDDVIQLSNDGKRMLHVRCSCGKEEFKREYHLRTGRTVSCKHCSSKRTAIKHPMPTNFKGVGGLSKTHFSTIKSGAERRNIPFNLDIEYLWDLYIKQKELCALTSLPIILQPAIKGCNVDWSIITASLDRIDNTKGYEEGNVWWVHKEANRLKNNYSLKELLFWSNRFILTHGNPEPSAVKEIEVAAKVQRLTGEDSSDNPDTSAQLPLRDEDIV